MKEAKICFVFIVVGFVLTVPAFYKGMVQTYDILVYSAWHKNFSAQFFSGDLYPRWLMEMNGGRGSSVFFFYPPLAFYVSSFLGLLLPLESPAWFPIYLSYGLALGLSGVTSYVFLRSYAQWPIAFILALYYMLAPYHLFVNFYYRFAYPEFWALVWAPLLFYFVAKTVNEDRKFSCGLSISYALLLLTHLPSFIVLTPLLIIYALFLSRAMPRILSVVLSLSVGFLASAFYAIPMLLYQPLISLNKMWVDGFSVFNNFYLTNSNVDNTLFLKMTLIDMLVVVLLFLLLEKPLRKQSLFWLGAGCAAVFLMFECSSFVWAVVPLLHKIQFPWRLNFVTLLAIIALSATALQYRMTTQSFFAKVIRMLLVTLLVAQTTFVLMQILPLSKGLLTESQEVTVEHAMRVNLGVVEYVPRWSSEEIAHGIKFQSLDEASDRIIAGREGVVSVTQWTPEAVIFQTASVSGFDVLIRQFYFPNWEVTADNEEQPLDIRPGKDGLIEISVPPGQHTVKLELVKGPAETLGQWLSLITIAALVFFQARRYLWSQRCHS